MAVSKPPQMASIAWDWNYRQLADSFASAFLGSKTRRLGASHLFRIKQGDNETLKSFLERFDKDVFRVEGCSDDTLMVQEAA